MGNRILKTGLLSLAAASVLTTSAFADISTKVTHSNTGVLDKNGGKKEVFQINIANTDSDYSYLEKFSIDINSTIPDVSFLKQIAIYRGNTQAANLIKAFPVQDTDTDSTAGISTVLDLTEVAQEKTRFLNEGSNPTIFIITLEYDQMPTIDQAELNVTLKDDATYNKLGTNSGQQLSDTLSTDSDKLPAKMDIVIDTTNPSIVDAGFIPSSTTTGKATSKKSDGGNKNYSYNESFDVNISFTENLDKDYTGVLYLSYFKDTTKAFKFVDAVGHELNITNVKTYQKGDTYSLSSSAGDEGNKTILELTVQPTTPIVGDVKMEYAGGFLKDEAGNFVKPTSSPILVFDDTVDPSINKVYISFEDTTKGEIVLSEQIDSSNLDKLFVYGSDTAKNQYEVELYKDQVRNEANASGHIHSHVPFSLNKKIEGSLNGFSITIIGADENNITNAPLKDLGGNSITKTESITGSFATENIMTKITPNEWNLISIPSGLVTTSQQMFLTGTVQTIWGYENGTWVKSPRIIEAGKGYWVKGLNVTDSADRNFSKTQATGYGAKTVDEKTVIKNNSSTEWRLLGIPDTNLSWVDAYSQVQDNCHTVSIYAYRPSVNPETGDTQTAGWNLDNLIPALSGIWVKQENCK